MYKVKDIEAREMLVPYKKIQLDVPITTYSAEYNPFEDLLGYGNVNKSRPNTRYFVEVTSSCNNISIKNYNGDTTNYREEIIFETHCNTVLAFIEYFHIDTDMGDTHVAKCTFFTDFSEKDISRGAGNIKQITCTLVRRLYQGGRFYTSVKEYLTKDEIKSFGIYEGDFIEKEEIILENSIGYIDSNSYVYITITNPNYYVIPNEKYILRINNDIELEGIVSSYNISDDRASISLAFEERITDVTHYIHVVNNFSEKKAQYRIGSSFSYIGDIQLIHKNKSKIASNTYVDNQVKEVALLTLANAGLITPLADDDSILLDEDGKVLLV